MTSAMTSYRKWSLRLGAAVTRRAAGSLHRLEFISRHCCPLTFYQIFYMMESLTCLCRPCGSFHWLTSLRQSRTVIQLHYNSLLTRPLTICSISLRLLRFHLPIHLHTPLTLQIFPALNSHILPQLASLFNSARRHDCHAPRFQHSCAC